MKDLGVPDIPISNISRLGKPKQTGAEPNPSNLTDENRSIIGESQPGPNSSGLPGVDPEQPNTQDTGVVQATAIKHRPIRFAVPEQKHKWDILKKAPNVRNLISTLFNPGKVWISPDHTIIERKDHLEVRNELRTKRSQFPNDKYVIKNGKVVRSEGQTPSAPVAQ